MNIFKFLVRFSPWLFGLSVVFGIVSGVSSAALMAMINDRLAEMANPNLAFFRDFLILVAVAIGSQLGSRLILLRLATRAVRAWRVRLCEQLLKAPLRQLEEQGSSGLMATLTNDISEVTEALTKFPMQCVNAAVIVACFGYLFWMSWTLAAGFLVTMVAGIVTYECVIRRSRSHMQKLRDTWDELIEHFTALVDGNKELKLNRKRRDSFTEVELLPTATLMMNEAWKFNSTFAIAETSGQVFFYLLIISIPLLAPRMQVSSQEIITGFILMLLYMSSRISEFVGAIPVFHRADVSKKKIESLGIELGQEELVIAPGMALESSVMQARFNGIEMKQLTYQYQAEVAEDSFQLGPVNVAFAPGEIVFVIGGNGSGKSSFARLLTGLYTPSGGELRISGQLVDDSNRDEYRQHFSAVFSDFHLFKNLYEAMPEERRLRAERFLETLQLSKKVSLSDGSFSTVSLSAGQRKRLALLTSFLEDRQVYVFDEWASDQDPAFKQVFYYEILPELAARGKTVIVISHDDHYYRAARRIVRFENGRIIEDRCFPHAVPSERLAG
jgi:putative ATP-binding cassette transporter